MALISTGGKNVSLIIYSFYTTISLHFYRQVELQSEIKVDNLPV